MYRAELARIAAGTHRGLGNTPSSGAPAQAEENKENLMLINNLRGSIKQEAAGENTNQGEDDEDMPQDLRMHAGGDSSQVRFVKVGL